VTLLDVDRICVVIGRTRHKVVQAEIQEAARQGARLIELRLDFLKKAPDFKRLLADKPCPIVATVRRPAEGGKWDGSEDARRTLLRQAIVAGFDWVDLESDVADSIRRFGSVKRIVSYHNFREVPADLEKIHQRMCAQDADVVKLVVRAQSPADNLRVLGLLLEPARPTVAFCMGDLGLPSRILAPKYGAPFTYAAFNKERNVAPGLPSFAELKQVYNIEALNSDTQVFGVIGDPVGHSLSPLIHNLAFRRLGLNAVYLPFRVPRGELDGFLRAFASLPVQGYSVTIPHKEAAAAAARRKDGAVEQTQAANTLIRSAEGFDAYNTDYQGVLDTLHALLPQFATPRPPAPPGHAPSAPPPPIPPAPSSPAAPSPPFHITGAPPAPSSWAPTLPQVHAVADTGGMVLASKVVLVLGAGGVARAVTHALHREGALVTVSNRTAGRAQTLANEVGCRHVEWNARHGVLCDLVVNCTSVGMHPNVDEAPLHPSFLKPGLVVFDTVYTPEQTLLVREARERGCHVITGVELFVRQAALQFSLFTGRDAPLELIRKVVKRALSPVAVRSDEDERRAGLEAGG
jgi:3-dehydroquinate dehydratase/shikimate dehydrogenase